MILPAKYIKSQQKKLKKGAQSAKQLVGHVYTRAVVFVRKRPVASFFSLLVVLFLLIASGSILRKPPETKSYEAVTKHVSVYRIGSAPTISAQGQIEKSGVITIVAQSSGIVQSIPVTEGQILEKGTVVAYLSTNYFGGNAPYTQRLLAEKQAQQVTDTYDLQMDVIAKQKELALKTDENNDSLREITEQSQSETQDALSLNEDILNTINEDLQVLESTDVNGSNKTLILATKQLKSQFLSAVNSLKQALRTIEYQSDENKPPSELSNLQKDMTLKQLEIQEKTLALTKEIVGLQVQLARITEGLMYPAAPFKGVVERVHVRVGQSVNPGTPIVTFNCKGFDQSLTIVATVPDTIARTVSRIEPSTLYIGDEAIKRTPTYVSTESTHGNLYSVIYTLDDAVYHDRLSDKSSIRVDIPIGYPDTGSAIPFIPLDSVHQTQDNAFVFVAHDGTAESREVTLGNVFGRFVEVTDGLNNADIVVLDRNVVIDDVIAFE